MLLFPNNRHTVPPLRNFSLVHICQLLSQLWPVVTEWTSVSFDSSAEDAEAGDTLTGFAVGALEANSVLYHLYAVGLMNRGEESRDIRLPGSRFGVNLEVERTVDNWLEEVSAPAAFEIIVALDTHGDTEGSARPEWNG